MTVDNLPAYRNHRILGIKSAWLWAAPQSERDAFEIFVIWLLTLILPWLAVWLITGGGILGAWVGVLVGVLVFNLAVLLVVRASIVRRRYQKVIDVLNVLEREA